MDNIYDEEYDREIEDKDGNSSDAGDAKKKNKIEKKQEEMEKRRAIIQQRQTTKILKNCRFCLANNFISDERIISYGSQTLLILPD